MNSTGKLVFALSLAVIGLSGMSFTAFGMDEGKEGMKGEESMHGKMGGMDTHMAKELDLSSEQMEKIKANKMAGEKQEIQDEADMKSIHLEIKGEMMKDKPDMAKIETMTQKMGVLEGKEALAMIKDKIYFRSVLTPEQKKKLDQMMMDMGMSGHKMEMHHGK